MTSTILQTTRPRDPDASHRAATPLELLFDLVSVIAIAAAAVGLHHAISEQHATEGVIRFGLAFFAIWWAWMNYTWYASAYDNDDAAFRLFTMVIMGASLVLAAGIDPLFADLDVTFVIIGYAIMRVAMAILWFRAASGDPSRRQTNLIYGIGILLVQTYWIATLFLAANSPTILLPMVLVGCVAELAVPIVAERAANTPWHRHHIIERYGLLNIIVLGEILLGATLALNEAFDGTFDIRLVHIAMSALAVTFAMWWLYFSDEDHLTSNDLSRALLWGYGHFFIFAAGAAVGAGFGVLIDIINRKSALSIAMGDLAVALPLAIYALGLWAVRDRFHMRGPAKWVIPMLALTIIGLPFLFPALEVIAVVFVTLVVVRVCGARRAAASS